MLRYTMITAHFQPFPKQAKFANEIIQSKLIESFLYLAELTQNVIGTEYTFQLKRSAHRIKQERKLDGYIYVLYQELINAIKLDQVKHVESVITKINNYRPLEYFTICNYGKKWLGTDKYHLFEKFVNRDDLYKLELASCSDSDFENIKKKIEEGFKLLFDVDHNFYENTTSIINEIIILHTPSGPIFHSGTTFYIFGTIFIGKNLDDNILPYLELIIHEASHLYLYALNVHDELVLNKKDEKYEAPFRQDKRPIMGIYHATFVAARLCYFFKLFEQVVNKQFVNIDHLLINKRKNHYLAKFKKGLQTITNHGLLTQLATSLLNEASLILL